MGPIDSPETSVSSHLTLSNNPKTEESSLIAGKAYDLARSYFVLSMRSSRYWAIGQNNEE
jgi:hypothetical protein